MLQRRDANGFNLAFLDVMACGLGAVILIFMLVKFNAQTPEPVEELKRLKGELAQLMAQQNTIQSSIAAVDAQKKAEVMTLAQIKSRIEALKRLNAQSVSALSDKKAVLAKLEKSIAAAAPNQAEDKVELAGSGEETYLLGLKVQGSHIGILLDNSASMTNDKLIDIVRSKIGSDAEKKAAAKWQRTKRVARWLLARVPPQSTVSMVSFNQTADVVGSQQRVSGNDKSAMAQVSAAIETLVPEDGTNLQSAISKIVEVNPKLTNLYVITDGLPTLGDQGSGLNAFRHCGSFFGKSLTITGECRAYLFAYTVKNARLRDVEVNVVLLPLEGDPAAADAYWQWSAATGGLLISPARSWP